MSNVYAVAENVEGTAVRANDGYFVNFAVIDNGGSGIAAVCCAVMRFSLCPKTKFAVIDAKPEVVLPMVGNFAPDNGCPSPVIGSVLRGRGRKFCLDGESGCARQNVKRQGGIATAVARKGQIISNGIHDITPRQ